MLARRSFLTGFAALLAAPAIVQASQLMPLRGQRLASILTLDDYVERILAPHIDALAEDYAEQLMPSRSLLSINEISREAVKLYKDSNAFFANIDEQYDEVFAVKGAKIGSTPRVRLAQYPLHFYPAAKPCVV